MKSLALFAMFVLIFGTTSPLLVNDVHAQNDPNILLRIAQQADNQIQNQLEKIYGNSVPKEIQDLYEEGHYVVVSLEESLKNNNMDKAKKDFLSAMKIFQQISRMISAPTSEIRAIASDASDRIISSELNRLYKYFENLKSISQRYDTGINFEQIDDLFEHGRAQIQSGDIEGAKETIEQLKSLINDIQKNIREHASNTATQRAKAFLEEQLDKIALILENTESSEDVATAYDLIDKINDFLSKDKLSDAKKTFVELIRLVQTIEKSNH